MPITRSVLIDDDGSGTTGSILNNAWQQTLYDQIDAAALTTAFGTHIDLGTITGVNHNYNPASSANKVVWYLFPSVGAEPTGIAAATPGTMHLLINIGNPLLIRHLNTGSTLANRLIGPGYVDYTLNAWNAVTLIYGHMHNNWIFLKPS